jgi:cell division protein FtsW
MYLSFLIDKKQKNIRSFISCFLPFIFIIFITGLILLKQPDFGTTVIIGITAFIIFFLAEIKNKYLTYTFFTSIPLLLYLICCKTYRLKRIFIFLNPWEDAQGRGYQIIQSLIAIGSGGIFGKGIANSQQKISNLPMQHVDFIFAIIAEETGFLGAIIIISLFFLLFFFGICIALSLHSPFAFFTTLSFVILLYLQAIINIMVTIGMLPTKGLGLPFISYGGSSLIASLCMIGIINNFTRSSLK